MEQPNVETPQGDEDTAGFAEEWDRIALEEEGLGDAPPLKPSEGLDEDQDHQEPTASGQPPQGGRQSPAAGASPPAGSETTEDVWANATDAQRQALTAIEERLQRSEQAASSSSGRASALQRELNELRTKIQSQPAPGGAAGTGGGDGGKIKGASDEELERIAKDYDDFAPAFVQEIRSLREEVQTLQQDRNRRAELEQAQSRLRETEDQARQEQALTEAHPDWGDVVKSQAFADWALAQPRMVMDALVRNGNGIVDAAESSKIVSDYKRDTGFGGATSDPLAAKRASQLAGSRHIPGRAPAMQPRGEAGTYDEEWNRADDEDRRKAATRR